MEYYSRSRIGTPVSIKLGIGVLMSIETGNKIITVVTLDNRVIILCHFSTPPSLAISSVEASIPRVVPGSLESVTDETSYRLVYWTHSHNVAVFIGIKHLCRNGYVPELTCGTVRD